LPTLRKSHPLAVQTFAIALSCSWLSRSIAP